MAHFNGKTDKLLHDGSQFWWIHNEQLRFKISHAREKVDPTITSWHQSQTFRRKRLGTIQTKSKGNLIKWWGPATILHYVDDQNGLEYESFPVLDFTHFGSKIDS